MWNNQNQGGQGNQQRGGFGGQGNQQRSGGGFGGQGNQQRGGGGVPNVNMSKFFPLALVLILVAGVKFGWFQELRGIIGGTLSTLLIVGIVVAMFSGGGKGKGGGGRGNGGGGQQGGQQGGGFGGPQGPRY